MVARGGVFCACAVATVHVEPTHVLCSSRQCGFLLHGHPHDAHILFFALSICVLCRGKVLGASVGAPGCCGDSTVWTQSKGYKLLSPATALDEQGFREFLPPGHYFISDCAYTLEPWLMRPYRTSEFSADFNEQRREEYLSRTLRIARRVVERRIGIMKKRWLILVYPKEDLPKRRVQDVWCCLIMHNILLEHRYPVESDRFFDPDAFAKAMRMLRSAIREDRRNNGDASSSGSDGEGSASEADGSDEEADAEGDDTEPASGDESEDNGGEGPTRRNRTPQQILAMIQRRQGAHRGGRRGRGGNTTRFTGERAARRRRGGGRVGTHVGFGRAYVSSDEERPSDVDPSDSDSDVPECVPPPLNPFEKSGVASREQLGREVYAAHIGRYDVAQGNVVI